MRHVRIRERLIIKEKQKRERSFPDMTSGLSILSVKNGEHLFSKDQIKKVALEKASKTVLTLRKK
jgi:hypothetical protein